MANRPRFSPEQLVRLKQQRIDRTASVLAIMIKAVMWVAIAYFALLAIRALAGHATSANFVLAVRWLASGKKLDVVAWLAMISAIIYAGVERSLRKRKTRYLQERIRKLEMQMDPNRSSSGLTEAGETREEDQL